MFSDVAHMGNKVWWHGHIGGLLAARQARPAWAVAGPPPCAPPAHPPAAFCLAFENVARPEVPRSAYL